MPTESNTHSGVAPASRPVESVPSPGRLATIAVVAWVALEVAVRWSTIVAADRLLGAAFVGNAVGLVLGFPIVAGAIGWYAIRSGSAPSTWGYDWSRRAVLAGVLCGLLGLGLSAAAAQVDALLFDLEGLEAGFSATVETAVDAYPWIVPVFVLGNGIVVPFAEELVWRGIVQTALVERLGAPVGIGVTALLFALKHVVVDLSVARLTTLLVLALVYGLVRHRWGTGASTVAHAVANLVATAGFLATTL